MVSLNFKKKSTGGTKYKGVSDLKDLLYYCDDLTRSCENLNGCFSAHSKPFYLYIVDAPGLEVLLCVVFLLFWYCSIAFPNRIDFPIFCFCVMSMSAFAFVCCLQKIYITRTQVYLRHSIVRPQRRPHLRPSVVFLVAYFYLWP